MQIEPTGFKEAAPAVVKLQALRDAQTAILQHAAVMGYTRKQHLLQNI